MERRTRPGSGSKRHLQVCESRYLRCGRPRWLWPVGLRPALWLGLGAERRSIVGTLQSWPMDVGGLLRLDLGQWRSMGLGSLSLWALVSRSAIRMGVVSR